jgi:hypothetical protein
LHFLGSRLIQQDLGTACVLQDRQLRTLESWAHEVSFISPFLLINAADD